MNIARTESQTCGGTVVGGAVPSGWLSQRHKLPDQLDARRITFGLGRVDDDPVDQRARRHSCRRVVALAQSVRALFHVPGVRLSDVFVQGRCVRRRDHAQRFVHAIGSLQQGLIRYTRFGLTDHGRVAAGDALAQSLHLNDLAASLYSQPELLFRFLLNRAT